MATEKTQNWLPVALIAGALVGWMTLLAAGAYWAPGAQEAGNDHRKLWVVAATTGSFLLLWALVLGTHQLKSRRQASPRDKSNDKHTNSR